MKTLLCLMAFGVAAFAQAVPTTSFDASKLDALMVTYKGQAATRLTDNTGNGGLAILKEAPFHNGTIEVDLAGHPASGSPEAARGFVGIAFRVQSETRHELIYLRPTNGRRTCCSVDRTRN